MMQQCLTSTVEESKANATSNKLLPDILAFGEFAAGCVHHILFLIKERAQSSLTADFGLQESEHVKLRKVERHESRFACLPDGTGRYEAPQWCTELLYTVLLKVLSGTKSRIMPRIFHHVERAVISACDNAFADDTD
eukprot:6175869-Pleurochrysis_carterae.AAC.11